MLVVALVGHTAVFGPPLRSPLGGLVFVEVAMARSGTDWRVLGVPTEVDRPDHVLRMMWQPRLRRGVWADTERGVAAMASITPPPSPWLAESETAGLLEGVRRWAESRPAGTERERVLACVARLRTPSLAAGRG